jgi:hypothetical protein
MINPIEKIRSKKTGTILNVRKMDTNGKTLKVAVNEEEEKNIYELLTSAKYARNNKLSAGEEISFIKWVIPFSILFGFFSPYYVKKIDAKD